MLVALYLKKWGFLPSNKIQFLNSLFSFQTCQRPPHSCHQRPCQARPHRLQSKMDHPRLCPQPQEHHRLAHLGHPEANINPVRPQTGWEGAIVPRPLLQYLSSKLSLPTSQRLRPCCNSHIFKRVMRALYLTNLQLLIPRILD